MDNQRNKGRVRLTIDELTDLIKSRYAVSNDFTVQAVYFNDSFDIVTLLTRDPAFEFVPEGGTIPFYIPLTKINKQPNSNSHLTIYT